MEFNSLIFPKCKSSCSSPFFFGKVVYIPRDSARWVLTAPFVTSQSVNTLYKHLPGDFAQYGSYKCPCIPCAFYPCWRPSSKVLLYFHGNAEDAFAANDWFFYISKYLSVHVLAMEYRGYGLYEGEPSAKNILEDAEVVYRYTVKALHIDSKNIWVLGRSIGSGPACYLASKYNPSLLILMSPFTSLRAAAKKYVGPLLQYLVAERFNNLVCMETVKSPVFILHGKKDDTVPVEHSVTLSKAVKGSCKLVLAEAMDHNCLDFFEDFLKPLKEYCQAELKISTKPKEGSTGLLVFPLRAFNKPTLN